ncbi:MAG: phosphate/phosphite/phosphonate ABC transporter substrate-binding protein [Sulfuricaulis sp.]|nr:PhnD/SsuA/transferrin family substrate-binding protein [Sulfuricaulis sp.]MCR4346339.1 phosphate/phosphite/phosphonate ABC transporter substrate-binding protein [Sulfuricaulis sp.]
MAYQGVVSGKCVGAVMRDKLLDKLDKDKNAVRVISRSPGVPNQAFSAGMRFSTEEQNKIIDSLLSTEARKQLPQFFNRYSKEKDLLPANDTEFRDLIILLKDSWGF